MTSRTFTSVAHELELSQPDRLAFLAGAIGWRVLPLVRDTKRPALKGWTDKATTDFDTIGQWFYQDFPYALCGVATGRDSGVWVLDVDVAGIVKMQALSAQHEPTGRLPQTYTVRTPSGGYHLYWQYPADVEIKTHSSSDSTPTEWQGIDSRGWGGQVVAPRTHIPGVGDYEPIVKCSPVPAPAWLVEHFTRRTREPWTGAVPSRSADAGLTTWAADQLQIQETALTNTTEGRNGALNTAAYLLAGIAVHGLLDKAQVFERLMFACTLNGLLDDDGANQCTATFESGWEAGWIYPSRLPMDRATLPEWTPILLQGGVSDNGANEEPRTPSNVLSMDDFVSRNGGALNGSGDSLVSAASGDDNDASTEYATDYQNAEAIWQFWGDEFLFTFEQGWLTWNGKFWQSDGQTQVYNRCRDLSLILIGRKPAAGDAERRVLHRRIERLQSNGGMEATVSMLSKFHNKAIREFDTNPWLLNCPNGTIDLKAGEFREHRRDDYITRCTRVDYDPQAHDDVWESFIAFVLPEQERAVFKRFIGTCLTGINKEKAFLVPTGPTNTGKSTATEPVFHALGEAQHNGYAVNWEHNVVTTKMDDDRRKQAFADARAARMVIISEMDRGTQFHDPTVKKITGGDWVRARALYGKDFDYKPGYKLVMHTNYVPRTSDKATQGRLKMIPFHREIPENQRNTDAPNYLSTNENAQRAILAWAVQGCMDWVAQGGLGDMPWLDDMLTDFSTSSSQVDAFIADCLLPGNAGDYVDPDELWNTYYTWALGQHEKPYKRRTFEQSLKERAFKKIQHRVTNGSRPRVWVNIRLRTTQVNDWDTAAATELKSL